MFQSTLQRRFVVMALLMLAVLSGIIVYTQNQVGQITEETIQSVAEIRQMERRINEIRAGLQKLEQRVYQRTVIAYADEGDVEKKLMTQIEQVDSQIEKLFATSSRHNDWQEIAKNEQDSFAALTVKLKQDFQKIKRYIGYYNMVIVDTRLRFPFAENLNNKLLPLNNEFVTSIGTALTGMEDAELSREYRQVRQLLIELRYAWIQKISAFRMFVLSRSGMFDTPRSAMQATLSDRDIFVERVWGLLTELQQLNEQTGLPFEVEIAIEQMNRIHSIYEEEFNSIKPTLMSDEWRIDQLFLHEKLQPEFGALNQLVSDLSERVKQQSTQIIGRTDETVNRINLVIWLSAVIFVILILLGYLMFERLIRRPVRVVADAMNAEASGESFYPIMSSSIQETQLLVDAFHNMQEQVHSRQARLESILGSAAEGIITIDKNGVIESFNKSAEKLFGYGAKEMIGANIKQLFPEAIQARKGSFVGRLCQGNISQTNSEIDTVGLHRDGTTFPMSIKIGEMNVAGQQLYTAMVDDVSERMTMISNLRHLAEHDSLTGLANRYFFLQELERVVQRAARGLHGDVALLYIDMDNFKYVNDTMGHMAGDKLLIEVSGMLKKRSRDTDLVARIGGDEFAVILYDVEQYDALKAADAFREKLGEYRFSFDGNLADVGCSVGVAMVEQNVTRDELLARADLSCNAAKRSGRNKVHLYSDIDKQNLDNISDDMGWVRRIKEAVRNDRFVFALQPIMHAGTGEISRFEALLRMLDEQDELIMPGGFIPPAERFSMMPEIDRWVVNHAVGYLASEDSGDSNLSINLSASSFDNEAMIDFITDRISQTGIDPTRITFEITETMAMADLELTASFLEKLRSLGCRTALDDFGIGYSSFAYLKELPVDYVKIDGSFVRDIDSNELNRAIVKSMNDVAQAMGKLTVAEFIETESVMNILELIGLDYLQGYYIGRPEIPDFERRRITPE
ncbi:PAS domain S-box-containing protein/diguanylate cyclase (GGDEF)-like protein [Thiohalophilus thiocyanatoxydans]|uniref:PAS domain S-box-containing protein/diguanylate cyclase (GGDEF)-like protein n=2 Tax=Thiohalophilus thiocyanatoxydans TaxID=381308 RepID=A0A4R8IPF0_9GAMM|nr:PAS domain S-box-containing protein/diguanylate cyclase (GGDEF)-like protein [Thiohalophilus thiocyanatoxydans]